MNGGTMILLHQRRRMGFNLDLERGEERGGGERERYEITHRGRGRYIGPAWPLSQLKITISNYIQTTAWIVQLDSAR